jgi:hypothetical protein
MRGAVLVLAAVVLGVVLLQVVDVGDTGTGAITPTSAGERTTSTTDGDTTTTSGGDQPLKEPAELRIQVLNGAGIQGAAATMTEALAGNGYTNAAEPGDTDRREGNAVQCKAGLEREAAALATQVGEAVVEDFPATPPASVTDATVECLVIVGAAPA